MRFSFEKPFEVHGLITDATGREISGAHVTVWWHRIRSRVKLAEGHTSEEGQYRITYQPPDDAPRPLLITVEATHSQHISGTIESSLTPSQPDLQIDLAEQPHDRSEFTTIRRAMEPLLQNLNLTDIVESEDHHDISFLARELEASPEQIMIVAVSARLEAAYNKIPAQVFYAFIRQRVPAALPSPLLDASQGFTLIESLISHIASLIFALAPEAQRETLEKALKQNLINQHQFAGKIAEFVNLLQGERTADALGRPFIIGKTTLGQLLDAAQLVDKEKQQSFAKALANNTQSMRNFWRTLSDGQHGFTTAEISAVQRTLEVGAFVKNHLPLTQELLRRFNDGSYKSLSDLARISVKDWIQLVNQTGGAPANINSVGDTTSEAEVFSRVIYARVTRAFPTAAIASRITNGTFIPSDEQAPLNQFFLNNPSLELGKTNLPMYLEQQGDKAFSGIAAEDKPKVIANAKRMQRVLRTTPDVDTTQTLLDIGINSATQIATMGKQQFFTKATNAGLTKREANRVFQAGAQRYASLVSLVTQHNRDLVGIWPRAMGSTSDLDQPTAEAVQRDESLATLFGSQDYCAVDSCTSVLSPAAYLCDLLLWLRNHPLTTPSHFANALLALFNRRPDIGHIMLNCPNTQTPLPYIDLVNEILEDAVSPPGTPVWKQTGRSAQELRAGPEHVNDAAYVTLASASYPHTLPYNRSLDELRTYLLQSGIALWQLRQALLPLDTPPSLSQEASVAAEYFRIDSRELSLITTANFVPLADAWNTGGVDPVVRLASVPTFLQAASITYEHLLELLEVEWIQEGGGGGAARITLQGVDDTCNTASQILTSLDASRLDLIHRFLRLWRHSEWKMWEIDLLLRAPKVGNGTLDENALVELFNFSMLQKETKQLSVDQLLAFFQDIDTASHRDPSADSNNNRTTPLYAKIFLDPVAVPEDRDLEALLTGGAVADTALNHHLAAIQAALQISPTDASTLFGLTDGLLTLSNLSLIYRVMTLARVLNLSLSDVLRIAPLTSEGSLSNAFASQTAMLSFIQQISAIKQSGFTIDALVYVLTPQTSGATTTTVGITQDQITNTVLPAIRAAIQQTHGEVYTSADPQFDILQRELAQLPRFGDPSALATATSIVNDTYTDTLANRNSFIADNFGLFMDSSVAQTDLAPLPGGLTPAQRQAAIDSRAREVLSPLATYLTQTRVIASLAANLQLQNDVTALLAKQVIVPGTSSQTALDVLTDPALISRTGGGDYTPINPTNFPNHYTAVQLLDKIGTVVRKLHLVITDLSWLLANANAYGGLDLTRLPVLNSQSPLSIPPLLNTVLLVKLDRSFNAANTTTTTSSIRDLYGLISAVAGGTISNEAGVRNALAEITGWTVGDITTFGTAVGITFGGGAGGDYTKPATYDRLRTLEAMAAATGGSGTQLIRWGASAPDETAAASAQGALKSRYSNEDWLKIAPAIMDPIRERRSAALKAYLLSQRDGVTGALIYGDTNALFDHFLIDVEMSSCEVTTRVVQAYASVQLFVERCLMGLEESSGGVTVDLTRDDTWTQWKWMKRYRIWEANRKVFLYPENWLIESQRPNRTELFKKLEQEVHQNENTLDYLESVALNYIDRLDEIAHLFVTGACTDPDTGALHVIARTQIDPPRFYHQLFVDGAWTGWQQIPLDIKAHQVVPSIYRKRLCLFWPDIKIASEPRQALPSAQPSSQPPSQEVAKYVSIGVDFSMFRNGTWAPTQKTKGKLFDIPHLTVDTVSDSRSVESLYSLKVQTPIPSPGYGATLFVDVFRLDTGESQVDRRSAVHLGRAVFDGRFKDLELRNLSVSVNGNNEYLLTHAQATYGPDAGPLLPLPDAQADPNVPNDQGLTLQAGAFTTPPRAPSDPATRQLIFTSASTHQQNVGPLLNSAPIPFRVVPPDSSLVFDPTAYFFYQDATRCFYIESVRYYQWGSAWLPVAPSNAYSAPFEVRYRFHRFYHPYTKLFWHQLAGGGFAALYNRNLQTSPDTIDPSRADVFSFRNTYQPITPRVSWGQDNEIIDFSPDASYSVYNWELFFHTPLYIAERLSENQRFEEALKWFHFIFDPNRQGPDPIPQRFWIPQPLYNLTAPQILQQNINQILALVNQRDPNALAQVSRWRKDPFNPFLIADQRPVAYMKRVLMSYLDNIINWADNLYSSGSREALNEATLLYIIAAEILGPQPSAITPPQHTDDSYDDLEPKLDAFANALVDIENVVGGGGGGGGSGGGNLPMPQTFYFKIPSNDKLLGYWTTVADRLFKLRHCQNIMGVTRQLALFDAPIDPGLLVRAQAAGVDIGSVLSDISAPLPNYRFTALYPVAMDFIDAVRGFGAQLLSALEKSDASALALLQATTQRQLMEDANQIYASKIDQAQAAIDATNQAIALQQSRLNFYNGQSFMNPAQIVAMALQGVSIYVNASVAYTKFMAAGVHLIPYFTFGAAGAGGSPQANAGTGGKDAADSVSTAADGIKAIADAVDKAADLAKTLGDYLDKQDDNKQHAEEANISLQQTRAQLTGAQLALQAAQLEQENHQESIDNLQQQIDFLQSKFTDGELYDWMVSQLSDTYFQSYRLAYSLAKRVERCYRYELGISDSSFIQFGYWDSLKKGLLAGESLSHDLRRMQASYLEQNSRRFEISRYVSLAALDPNAFVNLLKTGACDFDLPESLFDNDYPGHYQRHLVRASLTVVYPNAGKFDNVKGTLTLVKNSVRVSTDLGSGYPRQGPSDPRFVDQYAAAPQKIVLGNGQDDAGMFIEGIGDNLSDQRYLPFEGAGAISSWHLELPTENNEIDLSAVGDVVIHIYYTAVDGGNSFKQAVEADNAQNLPTSGMRLLSARNDFPAVHATENPLTPWESFISLPQPAGTDQTLVLTLSPSNFPSWSRGKTITVTGLTVIAISWKGGNFVLQPQAPLPTAPITLTPMTGITGPNVVAGTVSGISSASLGTWTFKLRAASASDFHSITTDDIGDVLLLVNFGVS